MDVACASRASPPRTSSDARWSLKQWSVLDGLKVDGAGAGTSSIAFRGQPGSTPTTVASATFLVEASAKRLNGKDRDTTTSGNDDYMRGGGFHDPSRNPNSYPMTGTTPYPSAVTRDRERPARRTLGARRRSRPTRAAF